MSEPTGTVAPLLTRRQYLTMRASLLGAHWLMAQEAVASTAIEHPEWDTWTSSGRGTTGGVISMPETPTPDEIARWAAAWTRQCGSCDAGLPMTCTCPDGDPRDVITRLLALVAAQAEQNAELRADAVVTSSRLLAAELDAGLVIEASRTRADKAEAELSALRATDEYQRWARAVVERDAARDAVAELRARVEAEIESWHHTVVEDCWYTCPAATEEREGETCCDDDRRGAACDCGLDLRKAKIRAALDGGAAT